MIVICQVVYRPCATRLAIVVIGIAAVIPAVAHRHVTAPPHATCGRAAAPSA